ncbi:unnamed protein product, partial [Parnassius mnemosyne]
MEVDVQKSDVSRKRRRSDLEEAVITIIDSSSNGTIEKRKRFDDHDKDEPDKNDEEPKEKNKVPIKNTVEQVDKEKDKVETGKSKDNEPSSSTNDKEKSRRTTPIKVVSKLKPSKTSTPKDKDVKDKNTSSGLSTLKQRPSRPDKSISSEEEKKALKRRNTRTKSLGCYIGEKS